MTKLAFVPVVFATVATSYGAGTTTATYKESFTINGLPFAVTRTETTTLTNKLVSMTGTYALAPGQTLNLVDIVWTVPAGNAVAQGTFNANSHTWQAAAGDFQMKTYFVQFQISQNGRKTTFDSPTYTYGKQ